MKPKKRHRLKQVLPKTPERQIEEAIMEIAWALPPQVVYWCAVRLFAQATTGKYRSQLVANLTVIEALKRWSIKERQRR